MVAACNCLRLQVLLAVPPYTLGREMSPPNLWLGTRGTVTSLHSDPSDNLLCQARTDCTCVCIPLLPTHIYTRTSCSCQVTGWLHVCVHTPSARYRLAQLPTDVPTVLAYGRPALFACLLTY